MEVAKLVVTSVAVSHEEDQDAEGHGTGGFTIFSFVAYALTGVVLIVGIVLGARHCMTGRAETSRNLMETRVHVAGLDREESGRMVV